jgi:hypothetical protein
MMSGFVRIAGSTLLLSLALSVSGCTVRETRRNGDNGDKATETKGAEITTPFGTLRARNEDNGQATGLAIYPGARVLHEKSDDHGGNVVIDTPAFGLKVVAVKYETDDPPEKVLDFYRKELRQFGKKVVECHPNHDPDDVTVGEVHGKGGELTCDKDNNDKGSTTELKAGTDDNQHVVGVEPKGKGTKFALVYVRVHGDRDNSM